MKQPPQDESMDTTPREDALGELIRLAEGRGEVPSERSHRVKQAVHAHWQQRIEQRRRKVSMSVGGALALAATLLLAMALMLRPDSVPTDGSVGTVVAVAMESSTAPVHVGQEMTAGFELDSAQGRVALLLGASTSVRLDRETRVRVLGPDSLALDEGRIYVDSPSELASMEIHTSAGLVRDIGTQFEVLSRDGALNVRVREGKVILDTEAGSHEIDLGGQLTIDASGRVARADTEIFGATWSWTTAVVTMLPLEGSSARQFLDWLARERGWQLEFSNDDVERNASSIMLSGSADGLTIEEALDAVLPTCRMKHQLNDGILLVSPMG
jgi:ferric-dicitrate binding protein FerR (iron transport regulator)